MMRAKIQMALLLGLAACGPKLPESGAGAGDYNSYLDSPAQAPGGFSPDAAAAAIDEAAGIAAAGMAAAGIGGAPVAGDQPLSALTTPGVAPVTGGDTSSAAAPAGATDDLFAADRPRGDAPTTIQADNGEMVYATGGLSDEQSFAAVTERESIESDKERIAANRAQYVVIPPTEIPQRPDNTGPDIVQYALATTNPPGVQLFDRPSFYLVNINTACNKYTSPDFAQQAFLAAGGPEHDSKGLDPDGDGFACDWDPTPFRNARQ